MKILGSKKLKALNESELLKENKNYAHARIKIDYKGIIKDIIENTFLILIAILPMLILPTYNAIKGENQWREKFFYNPDVLFLVLPFLIHCWLSYGESSKVVFRTVASYGYTFLLLIIVATFILLKIASEEIGLLQHGVVPLVIWAVVVTSYLFCVTTSAASVLSR